MAIFFLVLTIAILLVVSAMRPVRSELSMFELERRAETGDRDAKRAITRDRRLNDIVSLQRVVMALLLVVTALISVAVFGWLTGVIVAVIVALEYGAVSQFGFIKKLARKLYQYLEGYIVKLIISAPYFFKLIRNVSGGDNVNNYCLGSSAELRHLVEVSDNVLTPDDKKLIVHGLSFSKRLVSSVMTPRDAINSIDKSEFLGPLALNDLHKVGHNRLPVVSGDIDHVVGVLYLKNLLTLDVKRSTTAEKAMTPNVNYIRHDQTLPHALSVFLNSHHHLMIVVNEARETVGLITLNDTIEALLGRKVIDGYDAHDNLHAVASRKKA